MLYCVKNKNTLTAVAEEYMLMLGASTSRDLTGQGLGTKFIGIRAAVDGLMFGRASWDREGAYLAWYETEDYTNGAGVTSSRAVLVVKRPSGTKRFQMTVDTNLVESGWSQHLLGDAYPMIREVILDAADEDRNFRIDECDKMTYSPMGETWTYVEKTDDLAALMEVPGYYFRRGDEITWLDHEVGIAPLSSMNECQIFCTAGKDPRLAYAAWSSGRKSGQEVPDPAYDYVLRETADKKWVSMPKRLLEDVSAAQSAVTSSVMGCDNVDVMARVLQNVLDGGYEAGFRWSTNEWDWHKPTAKQAFDRLTDGGKRPIHYSRDDALFERAEMTGAKPLWMPKWMYDVGRKVCGAVTVHNILNVRESDEVGYRVPTAEERQLLMGALEFLSKSMPWQDWRGGHIFIALETDRKTLAGLHITGGDSDKIGINFSCSENNTVRGVAKTIIHEMVHHKMRQNSAKSNWHADAFAENMLDMMTPPSA